MTSRLESSSKHVGIGVPASDYLDDVREMGALVAEGANVDGPVYWLGATVNSPLVYSGEMLAKMMHAARHRIPLRRVQEILSSHRPPELEPEVKKAIQAILTRIGRERVLF